MKECLILGKPNCGKTLFLLNFAEHLGYRELQLAIEYPDGSTQWRSLALADARMTLVSPSPHHTRCLQAAVVRVPHGKARCEVRLTDSTGLGEGVHGDAGVRRAMVQTLKRLRAADVVLHLIDASRVTATGSVEAMGDLDHQLARYATGRGGYAVLATKMDLAEAQAGLAYIRSTFPYHVVIPVSALRKQGFKEVRAFVARFF
jgi:tRNA U34 5-carboxymethylaminomethyl modifying GTPase MnmE/TrmE